MQNGTALGIGRTENQACNTRLADRTGAHGTGFERNAQPKAIEPVIATFGGTRAQGEDLGMGCWIATPDRLVMGARHNPVGGGIIQHGPDRNLVFGGGGAGFVQRERHKARFAVPDAARGKVVIGR